MNRRTFLESVLASAAVLPASTRVEAFAAQQAQQVPEPPLLLSYTRAASKWVEALPLGNGRLGAMVFGSIGAERLQLNDDTLWSGGPSEWNNPGAKDALPEIRALLRAGRFLDADRLSKRLMGPFTQSYLPLGDLVITFDHGNVGGDYRRTLDLGDAIAGVTYRTGTVRYTREILASHPADVIHRTRRSHAHAARSGPGACRSELLRHRRADSLWPCAGGSLAAPRPRDCSSNPAVARRHAVPGPLVRGHHRR
jgi:hypothetical protein